MNYREILGSRPLPAERHRVEVAPGRVVLLLTPQRRDVKIAACDAREAGVESTTGLMCASMHRVARHCVVGWEGVTAADLCDPRVSPELADQPLDWSREAVAVLLDAQPDWQDLLTDAAQRLFLEREELLDERKKSSSRESTGSGLGEISPDLT